jgi:hypothetical protein
MDPRILPESINKALLTTVANHTLGYTLRPGESMTQVVYNILALLADNRITTECIHTALVRAASDGSTEIFKLLKVDPRVTNTSPFDLEEMMDQYPDAFKVIAGFLGNGQAGNAGNQALKCVNQKSKNRLNQ